jgi:hypothetical protein
MSPDPSTGPRVVMERRVGGLNGWALIIRALLAGSTATIGGVMVWMGARSITSEPRLFMTIVGQWGPLFVIIVLFMYGLHVRSGQLFMLIRDNTQAAQKMADAVEHWATRDDREQQKQSDLLTHVARQQEKMMIALDDMRRVRQPVLLREVRENATEASRETKEVKGANAPETGSTVA